MTGSLHRMLEPQERIVFQTTRRNTPRYWQSKLTDWVGTCLLGPGILIPFSGAPADQFGDIYMMAAGIIAVVYPIWLAANSLFLVLRPDQVIVTEKRLLHRAGGLFDSGSRSLEFAAITRIEPVPTAGPSAVRFRGARRSILVPEMSEAKSLEAALKKVIRRKQLESRSWPAKPEVEKIGFLTAWAGIMMVGYLIFSALGLIDMTAAPGTGLAILLALLLLGAVGALLAGPSLAYVVALGVARPFVSQERMQQIVDTSDWLPEWNESLVRRWVGLLYGSPPDARPG